MNVREIIQAYLKENGFDGLAGDDCGCYIGDLAPCSMIDLDICEPAYKRNCTEAEVAKCENPYCDGGGSCFGTKKPASEQHAKKKE